MIAKNGGKMQLKFGLTFLPS